MKNFKNINILSLALAFCLAVPNVQANEFGISDQKLQDIETKVNSMSFEQLNASRSMLIDEQEELNNSGGSGASGRLKEIAAELSTIQKALIAIAGLGAISALTNDGYSDDVPPVITIAGDNPATVELGSSYTDAGLSPAIVITGGTSSLYPSFVRADIAPRPAIAINAF
jgi:hypothetical protein